MNEHEVELCKQAAQSLKLRDIVLLESSFSRGESVAEEGIQQHKKGVRFQRVIVKEDNKKKSLFHIIVLLGTRVVDDESNEEVESARLHFQIEADFLVSYQITGELTEEAGRAFASFNGVHNVWPFWRQHVFDLVQRAHLPHLDIPLFSG